MKDLSVTLSGVKLDNPIIPASGTYGFGQEFLPYYDINILGSLSFKGTTAESRFGNPTPRIAECPNGMLNSVGLQNPGVEHVIAHELPQLRKTYAQLTPEEKASVSHRGKALEIFKGKLEEYLK